MTVSLMSVAKLVYIGRRSGGYQCSGVVLKAVGLMASLRASWADFLAL
jgi:hypothetical protein